MRLVTKDGIDRIIKANPIAALAAEHGVELRPLGKTLLVGRCPFEETATGRALLVEPSGRFRCLTCFRKGGNVIGFVMHAERVNFLTALERLAARAGLDLDELMGSPLPSRPAYSSEVPLWALTPPLELR